MSESQSEPLPQEEGVPNSWDSILITIDGPWDNTIRPRPPHIPPYMPGGKQAEPPTPPPPPDKPTV